MNKPPYKIIRDYLDVVFSIKQPDRKYSYLDAVIINKKIAKILFGIKIRTTDNIDAVEYDDVMEISVSHSLLELYEFYVRLDIYKTLGITLNEFKKMSIREKNIMLDYLDYKLTIMNNEMDKIDKTIEDQKNDNHNALF